MVARVVTACSLALFAVLVAGPALAQQVTATIDRNEIAANEMVTLRVRIDGGYLGQPRGPEGSDFRVARQSISTSRQITPQGSSTLTEVILALRPTRTGEDLVVGPVAVRTRAGEERTQPFRVRVTAAQRAPAAAPRGAPPRLVDPVRPSRRVPPRPGDSDVAQGMAPPPAPGSNELYSGPYPEVGRNEPFLVAQASHDQALVGEQVVVDYLLFQPRSVFGLQFSDPSEPDFGAFWFSNITDTRTRGRGRLGEVTVRNRRYDVALVHSYTVVPLEVGPLEIPSFSLDASIASGRGSAQATALSSQPLILDVVEPPDGAPARFAPGNVGAFAFSASLDRDRVRAGDSVSLTMTVQGSGLMQRLELPDVPEVDGARWFEPSDEHSADVARDGWLRGVASRRVSFVPQQEGELVIPALTFAWFDPWANTYREASTEPLTVRVEGTNDRAVTLEEVDETTEWAESLPEPRPLSAMVPAAPRQAGGPAFLAATALPPLSLAGYWSVLAWRARRSRTAPARERAAAGRDALSALEALDDSAQAAGEIASTLRLYLHHRSGFATSGAAHGRLETIAADVLGADAGAQLRALVERAERARYGGESDVSALKAEACAWIHTAEDA